MVDEDVVEADAVVGVWLELVSVATVPDADGPVDGAVHETRTSAASVDTDRRTAVTLIPDKTSPSRRTFTPRPQIECRIATCQRPDGVGVGYRLPVRSGLALLAGVVLLLVGCGPPQGGSVADEEAEVVSTVPGPSATSLALDPSSSTSLAVDDPNLCPDIKPLYPGANDLPEEATLVAEFPYLDGTVYLLRWDEELTYFGVIECFAGGGEGFSLGGPGEAWDGCLRWDFSNAGYGIVIAEDPAWSVEVDGESVGLQEGEGGLGVALITGEARLPDVEVLTEGACDRGASAEDSSPIAPDWVLDCRPGDGVNSAEDSPWGDESFSTSEEALYVHLGGWADQLGGDVVVEESPDGVGTRGSIVVEGREVVIATVGDGSDGMWTWSRGHYCD